MSSKQIVGGKRPLENKENLPRKKQNDIEDDLIEEALELESPEDDIDEPPMEEEVEEQVLGEAGKNWERPAPPPLDPSKDRLVFQQFEVDYTSGPPNKAFYNSDLQEVPIIRMFGVNEHGMSLGEDVPLFWFFSTFQQITQAKNNQSHGIMQEIAYAPLSMASTHISTSRLRPLLSVQMIACPSLAFSTYETTCYLYRSVLLLLTTPNHNPSLFLLLQSALANRDKSRNNRRCLRVELVQRQSLLYFQPAKSRPFLKITVSLPNLVSASKSIIEQGLHLQWLGKTLLGPTYESNVPYALRYMIDASIVGGNWVELPAGNYSVVPSSSAEHVSHCQIEAHVCASQVVSHPCEGEWAKLAPFRILSVDIECQGRKVNPT